MIKTSPMIRGLFVVAALYDGVLGLAFLVAGQAIFSHLGIVPPNHWAYVHFPALLLLVFAAMFLDISCNPAGNRRSIRYGIMLKIAYCGTAFYYWATMGIPGIWKPFAFADLAFMSCFIWAYVTLREVPPTPQPK